MPVDRRLRIIRGSNYGFSPTAVEITRVCNTYLDDAARQRLCLMLQSRDSRQPYNHTPYFSMQERKSLLEHYRRANQKLAAAVSADLREPFPQIQVDTTVGTDTSAMAADTDAVVRLLIDICLEQHKHRPEWLRRGTDLVGRLCNKLKQYIPH